MKGLGAQLRALGDRLQRHATKPQQYSATQVEYKVAPDLESSESELKQQPDEGPDATTLRLVAIAGVFSLTSADLLAFPEAARDFRKRLFGFPFEDAAPPPRGNDTS